MSNRWWGVSVRLRRETAEYLVEILSGDKS